MALLRFVAVAALALWVGGLVALGAIVAPTLFDVLETRDGLAGRETAGLIFGSVFEFFIQASWVLGGIVMTSLGLRAALGPRPKRMAIRTWTVAAMMGVGAVTAFVIVPRIDAARSRAAGPVAALATDHPVRVEFGRLHGASNVLALVTVIAGLGLLWVELRDQH
jgi:Domain of unknown function (DUF4149)